MSTLVHPLRFEPFLRPMVWGGRALERLGKTLATPEHYGESWEVSDHPHHRSVVAEGPWSGMSMQLLVQRFGDDLLGRSKSAQFPWLIKFLDCHDWLSVQVHPNDHQAKTLWPGEAGKTEAWLIFDVAPEGRVYAGFKSGVDEKVLRQALTDGAVADCLNSFTPQPGDFLFLSAGTVHAVGGGVLMAEIQQTSDATFRLFDWNRRDTQGKSRKLHIEESIACIDWSARPRLQSTQQDGETLASCPYFRVEAFDKSGAFEVGGSRRMQALIVTEGRAAGDDLLELAAGSTWVFPASMPAFSMQATSRIRGLLCTLP